MGTVPLPWCSCQEQPDSSLVHHKSCDSQHKQISKTWVSWIYKYIRQIMSYPIVFPCPRNPVILYGPNKKSVLCLLTSLGLPGIWRPPAQCPNATRRCLLCSLQQSPSCQHHQKPNACLKCVTSSFYSSLLLWHLSYPEAYIWACCLTRKHFAQLKGRRASGAWWPHPECSKTN